MVTLKMLRKSKEILNEIKTNVIAIIFKGETTNELRRF